MDWDQRCIRLCVGLVLSAMALRLCAGGALIPLGQAVTNPETASFLLYLQTGRVVRAVPELAYRAPDPPATEPEPPVTFSPPASITPATSSPIQGGQPGGEGYFPSRWSTSARFRAAA